MTYDELIEACLTGLGGQTDPIASDRSKIDLTPEGLVLTGVCTSDEYADDIRIRIDGCAFWVTYRDAEPYSETVELPVELPMVGRMWLPERRCADFGDLVGWAYSL